MELIYNPEVWQISQYEISLRIIISIIVGGVIGFERELGNHSAGFRTHILVCVGSTLIVLLSTYGFAQFANEPNVRLDPARLAAQVISGIGFLGAGTILRTGFVISGLTTAASLWVVAAIGLAVGAGFYYAAVLTAVAVVVVLFFFNQFEKYWIKKHTYKRMKFVLSNNYDLISVLLEKLNSFGVSTNNISLNTGEYEHEKKHVESAIYLEVNVKFFKPDKMNHLIENLLKHKDILHIEVSEISNL
ncbi:MgtC/SapB family protein [Paenibacillus marinisediminis]